MNIPERMRDHMLLSFEVFPPKTEAGMEKLVSPGGVLDRLCALGPDYVSCTYGAGGTNAGKNLEVLDSLSAAKRTIPVAHFTCVGSTRESVRNQLQTYLDHGVDHILALRGDLPVGWTGPGGDFPYAADLIRFARAEFGDRFVIACAGSPEGHIQSESLEEDIAFLRQKQDAGADFIMTQLCWDTDQFRRWLRAIRAAGVTLPVDAGIMPVLTIASTINIALSRNGCVIPRELSRMIARRWIFPNPFAPAEDEQAAAAKRDAFREEGLSYTARLIEEFLTLDIAGIHLYTMNRFEDMLQLVAKTGFAGRN